MGQGTTHHAEKVTCGTRARAPLQARSRLLGDVHRRDFHLLTNLHFLVHRERGEREQHARRRQTQHSAPVHRRAASNVDRPRLRGAARRCRSRWLQQREQLRVGVDVNWSARPHRSSRRPPRREALRLVREELLRLRRRRHAYVEKPSPRHPTSSARGARELSDTPRLALAHPADARARAVDRLCHTRRAPRRAAARGVVSIFQLASWRPALSQRSNVRTRSAVWPAAKPRTRVAAATAGLTAPSPAAPGQAPVRAPVRVQA